MSTASRTSRLFLCAILQATLAIGQVPTKPELEPVFLAPLENHTVTQGRDVYFTCVVNHLSSYKVAWIKSDSKAILAIHTHMVAHNQRLSVTHNGHNTWKLHVSNVQKNDSGTYMCQINTDPMRSQMGYLEVVIRPDILNDEDSTDGGVAVEGGSVRLRCRATGVPEPTVLWRREDSKNLVLRHESSREKQIVRSFDGDTLLLTNIQRSDIGAYLCIASNGVPPTVSKRFIVNVHFHPLIKVSNQLVAAPLESAVLIQCYVEASPKAMNSWLRDTGDKLMPSDKYTIEETMLNEYSLFMNLTIRSLEKRDFGGYICSSSNAFGKAEGVVRLQELHLAVKTTTTPTPPRHNIDVIKPGKNPPHVKNKPARGKHRKGEKKHHDFDEELEKEKSFEVTTGFWLEARTVVQRTVYPSTSRPPPWISLDNGVSQRTPHTSIFCLPTSIAVLLYMSSLWFDQL